MKILDRFLWFNYHNEYGDYEQNKFNISLRYTSYLDVSELSNSKDIFKSNLYTSMEMLRQRHLKKAHSHGAKIDYKETTLLFIKFYDALMRRQGEIVDKVLEK